MFEICIFNVDFWSFALCYERCPDVIILSDPSLSLADPPGLPLRQTCGTVLHPVFCACPASVSWQLPLALSATGKFFSEALIDDLCSQPGYKPRCIISRWRRSMRPASWCGSRPWRSSLTLKKPTTASPPWDTYSVSFKALTRTDCRDKQKFFCLLSLNKTSVVVLIWGLRRGEGDWENNVSLSHGPLLLHTGMAGASRPWW